MGAAAFLLVAAACGGDDDDDTDGESVTSTEEESPTETATATPGETAAATETATADPDDSAEVTPEATGTAEGAEDGDTSDGPLDFSPSDGGEYIEVVAALGGEINEEFPECQAATGLDPATFDPSTIAIPDECDGALEQFRGELESLTPPAVCETLHQIYLDLLDALAEGDASEFQEIFGDQSTDSSTAFVDSAIECVGAGA